VNQLSIRIFDMDATMTHPMQRCDAACGAGSASLILATNVVHLDPAPAVFEAMLGGWATQQRSRFLAEDTVTPRLRMVRRLVDFSNLYPWQWTPAEGESFIAHLRSGEKPVRLSTARGYEVTIRL
jgi:integrase/recombinase XerC